MHWACFASENLPEPRNSFAVVFSSKRKSIIIYGGIGDEEDLRSFAELDLRTMTWKGTGATAEAVVGHAAVLLNERMLMFGGWGKDAYSNRCMLFDPVSSITSNGLGEEMAGEFGLPWARRDHSLVAVDRRVFAYGGWDSLKWSNSDTSFTEMWQLDANWKWNLCEIYGETPCARRGHSLNYYPEQDCLVFFGGAYGYSRLLNDTFVLKLRENTSERIQTTNTPEPRAWHSGAIIQAKLYIFGGLIANYRAVNELWLLDLATWAWENVGLQNAPSPRCGHICLTVESSLLILGGKGVKSNVEMELMVLETTDKDSFAGYLAEINMKSVFEELKANDIVPPPIPLHLSRARFYTPSDIPFNPKKFPSVSRR